MIRARELLLGITRALSIPALAVFTALLIGALIILVTGGNPVIGYIGLFEGAFGKARSLSETAVAACPYILAGLAVALGFRGGLFNIGVEGQLFIGSICAVWVGYSIRGLPWIIHMPLAFLAGCLGGALTASIPGYLKAKTGAHEVITTIMVNYIAIFFTNWLVTGLMQDPGTIVPQTRSVLPSAEIPAFSANYRIHWGIVIAILAAIVVFWLLWKTVLGFEIRTVGANPDAARYAGINVNRNIVITMALSGALAGAAGAVETLGLNHYFSPSFSIGYGFDSIAVAVLGKNHPFGVVIGAFLFGALNKGASTMQLRTQIPIYIISIIQALTLLLVAADEIVRWLYRRILPSAAIPATEEKIALSQSWSGSSGQEEEGH
jgi:simple sugar transport system permease protein